MKKIIVLVTLLTSIVFSQENNRAKSFSNFNFGVYGGVNFESISEIGGAFYIEEKSNLTSNLNLKLSLGYYRTIESTNFTVLSIRESTIDSFTHYSTTASNVSKIIYDLIPISLGFQYVFRNPTFSPYIALDGSYNFIDYKTVRKTYTRSYSTYEDIPDEFKNYMPNSYPNNSFGIALGFGALYKIKQNLEIDFRYLFKYDNEIINSHQILMGLNF